MKNKKGIVYTITNKTTKETYVGVTTVSLHSRKLDHTERAKRGEKGKLFQSIATLGLEAFEFKEIDSTYSINELAEKEKMYIKQFKDKGVSLNIDAGGGFQKTVYKYNLEGVLVAKFSNLEDAAKSVNSTKQRVSSTCLSKNKDYRGFLWSYKYQEPFYPEKDCRKKKVVQYTISGVLIAEFNSVAEASRKTGASKTSIAKVCRGEYSKSNGFIWRYGT